MVSPAFFSVLALLVSAFGVWGFDWIDTLPECWQDCLVDGSASCDSARCICKASKSGSFLPDAVSCARLECDAENWTIEAFLIPLQAYCGAVGREIPEAILSSAQCAATQTSSQPKPTSTRKSHYSQHPHGHKSKSKDGDEVTSVFTTTITQTTTDEDGATLEIVVPVVVGPSTMSYGKTVTHTLGGESSATDSPTSASASPSPTPAASGPVSTPAQQGRVGSSTSSSKKAEKTSNSNGSPFENMQAGAGRWSISGALIGMGIIAGVFMRL